MIKINYNTDLDFTVVKGNPDEVKSRFSYSPETGMSSIHSTALIGYVDIETNTDEHVAEIQGTRVNSINFEKYLDTVDDHGPQIKWNVYVFADNVENDIELEELAPHEIPGFITSMLD